MLRYLWLLPIVHFIIVFYISYKGGRLNHLKHNYALMYLDWVFVPFNMLIVLSVNFSWMMFIVLLVVAIIASAILNYKWQQIRVKPSETKYFTTDKGLTPEGLAHFLFMSVQAALVLTVFLSSPISRYYLAMMGLLLVYLLGFVFIIVKIRKVPITSKVEMPLVILGIIAVLIRIIL